MTTKITSTQAAHLLSLIGVGHELGPDGDGNIVYGGTKLGDAMHILDMRSKLVWNGQKWLNEQAVQMLRDWADAVESLND